MHFNEIFLSFQTQKLSPKKNNTPQMSTENHGWTSRRQLNSPPNRKRVGHDNTRKFTDSDSIDYREFGSDFTNYDRSQSIVRKPIKTRRFTDSDSIDYREFDSEYTNYDHSQSIDWRPNEPGRSTDSESPFDFEEEPSFSGVFESTRIDGVVDHDHPVEDYRAPFPLSFDIFHKPQIMQVSSILSSILRTNESKIIYICLLLRYSMQRTKRIFLVHV